jgi:hypothetical protein
MWQFWLYSGLPAGWHRWSGKVCPKWSRQVTGRVCVPPPHDFEHWIDILHSKQPFKHPNKHSTSTFQGKQPTKNE